MMKNKVLGSWAHNLIGQLLIYSKQNALNCIKNAIKPERGGVLPYVKEKIAKLSLPNLPSHLLILNFILFSVMLVATNPVQSQCNNFAITKVSDNGNGTYTICATSLDQVSQGQWTVINDNQVVASGFGNSICATGTQTGFTLTFISNGVECSEAFEYGAFFDCGAVTLLEVDGNSNCAYGTVTLNDQYDFSPTGRPYVLNFGDGSPMVIIQNGNNSNVYEHQYPLEGGFFNVCITFQPYAETYLSCCYSIYIPPSGCCIDPYFSLSRLSTSESCVLSRYAIGNNCVGSAITQHIWEFEDGKVSYSETPPPHYFTDYVNVDNQVCVKHTMICCDVTVSYTACAASDPPAAYLGQVGQTRTMDQLLSGWWNQPTSIKVKNFIQQYSQNPSIPLIIDGILVVDVFSQFNGGTWYMAGNTPEGIESLIEQRNIFSLTNVTIQSASRIQRSACCIWSGIRSFGPSRTFMNSSTVNDAIVMLDYPSFTSIQRPFINIRNSYFNGNYWGIRSLGQPINFFSFYGNRFQGGDVCVCGCDVVNALDFRNMPQSTIRIKKEGTPNFITSYEQGIHADNVNLDIENFRIVDLQNFVPIFGQNPSEDDSRIGIDFRWNSPLNSTLKLDHVYFNDFDDNDALMRTGVKAYISNGKSAITCNASNPLSSIFMKRVETGYHLITEPNAKIVANIKDNQITATGTNSSYGFNISLLSSENVLRIERNNIVVSGGLSGGAGLNIGTPFQSLQSLKFKNNVINITATGPSAGVNHQKIFNSEIVSNRINLSGAAINGIDMLQGGTSNITCNSTDGGVYSIFTQASESNKIIGNYLEDANVNALRGQANCQGLNGTYIAYNYFEDPDEEGVFIEETCNYGPQNHNEYNYWTPIVSDIKARLEFPTQMRLANNNFFTISSVSPSISRPEANDPAFFNLAISPKNRENPCISFINEEIGNRDASDNAANRYNMLVVDTSIQNNLTEAEYAAFQQGVFNQLLDSIGWISTHANLNSFYQANINSFIGRSVFVQRGLNTLSSTIQSQQASLNNNRAIVDSLSTAIAAINVVLDTAQSASLIGQLTNNVINLNNAIQQLSNNMVNTELAFNATNQTTINAIATANTNLAVTNTHQQWEQYCNAITISILNGSAVIAADSTELCNIAQTCYSEGGHAVYAARTLTSSQLGVYFTDVNCTSSGGSPRIENGPAQDGVSVYPNPSSIGFDIKTDHNLNGSKVNIMLMDMTGKLIIQKQYESTALNQYNINTQNIPTGSYILQISDDKGWKVNKLVFVKD